MSTISQSVGQSRPAASLPPFQWSGSSWGSFWTWQLTHLPQLILSRRCNVLRGEHGHCSTTCSFLDHVRRLPSLPSSIHSSSANSAIPTRAQSSSSSAASSSCCFPLPCCIVENPDSPRHKVLGAFEDDAGTPADASPPAGPPPALRRLFPRPCRCAWPAQELTGGAGWDPVGRRLGGSESPQVGGEVHRISLAELIQFSPPTSLWASWCGCAWFAITSAWFLLWTLVVEVPIPAHHPQCVTLLSSAPTSLPHRKLAS